MYKTALIFGSSFALLSVVLGAFGAHALKEHLSEYSKMIYEKGILYQMFHSLSILFLALLGQSLKQDLDVSIWCFIFGIILFSGSLYLLAISGVKWLGMITPLGGVSFILGWTLLAWIIYRN